MKKQPPEPFYKKSCNFIKKETLAQVFSCEFGKILKNTNFIEHFLVTASVYANYHVCSNAQSQVQWNIWSWSCDQSAFTHSKLPIEKLEQSVKYTQS